MKIEPNGRCPVCKRKCLTYKRDRKYFCSRCDRAFDLDTGEFRPNFAWKGPDEPTRRHYFYGEPVYVHPRYWKPKDSHEPKLQLPTRVFYDLKLKKHRELVQPELGFDRQNDRYEEWVESWECIPVMRW